MQVASEDFKQGLHLRTTRFTERFLLVLFVFNFKLIDVLM